MTTFSRSLAILGFGSLPQLAGAQTDFTLELFHIADQEAGIEAIDDAPRLSAVYQALLNEDLGADGQPDNSIFLSAGDAIIPGLFFNASETINGERGIADILIQNELGIQAIALGNHEFDLGTEFLAGLIAGNDAGFSGANFPYLSANLDFSTDTNLASLVVPDHQSPQANSIAATTVITVNGEKVGMVGATTPTVDVISSPGDITISPLPFDGAPTSEQLDTLAAVIQSDVDALLAAHPDLNKVILLSHMQQLSIERELARRLTSVDIIVGGGSNTRLTDSNDRLRSGDSSQGTYPIFVTNAGNTTTAVVNTDGNYRYLGRLVIGFDAVGNILPASYDENVSGAYATDDQAVTDLSAGALVDPEIQTIVNDVRDIIVAQDSNFFGITEVYLNGVRASVRTEETNLGNLTADANLAAAKAVDSSVMVSLKNGGGIRAEIGEVVVPAGATEPSFNPPAGNSLSGRPEGGISQNAIENTLRFNNGLSLLTLTRLELVDVLEHGIANAGPGVTSGRFPQVSGVNFSYDPSLQGGDRLVSATIVDESGTVLDTLVSLGRLQGDPDETVRIVTLGFLAGGGDGYPFPQGASANRVDLDQDDAAARTGVATFAPDGSEQDTLAEFLAANFPNAANAYNEADTVPASDTRIRTEALPDFTLELLHLADQEGNTGAIADAPRLSAVLNALRDQDLGEDGQPDNTLTLSSGDAFIPGIFFSASEAAFGSAGIADIQIQNELGIQAVALGNHEFDLNTDTLAGLINGSAAGDFTNPALDGTALDGLDFTGANFPYLSSNLDFSTDANLSGLEVAGGQAPQGNTVTSSNIITVNGEEIAVIGATTPTLASISSPGSVGILPTPFAPTPTPAELDALAVVIQSEVDTLLAANAGLNKVIVLAHMQQLGIEQALAARLSEVDIIVAGGSNTRLFDGDDRVRDDDSNQGTYPVIVLDVDGNDVAVVNTDGSYKYVGRLVIGFDANGHLIPASYDEAVSGAYATDDQGVADLGAAGLVDPEVQALVDALEIEIILTESNVFGVANTFLNGNRSGTGSAADPDGVRTQETNLGNLTADANLAAAKAADVTVVASLKNGGGIRASIGDTIVPAGGSEAERFPNEELLDGTGTVIKPAGGINQNDIATTLAFNNDLILVTLTKAELVALLEHGVDALPGVSGRFPQIAGLRFSFDSSANSGEKIQNVVLVDESDQITETLVLDGNLIGDANALYRIVTLEFLSRPRFDDGGNFTGGGDGYPFPNYNTDGAVGELGPDAARINPVILATDSQTGLATFADDGTEQDALAEYLASNFPDAANAFEEIDQGPQSDLRIQNLAFRDDAVFETLGLEVFAALYGVPSGEESTLTAYAFGLVPGGPADTLTLDENNGVQARGEQFFSIETDPEVVALSMTFLRRANAAEENLTYVVEYSADMVTWFSTNEEPDVLGVDGEMEVVRATIPFFTPDASKARFFRLKIVNGATN